MSNTKKYVSLDKLGLYDEKIKKYLADADTASLNSAKAYADGLADNYEAAGAVATAKSELQTAINGVQANVDLVSAAASKAQDEVDALETYVGTIPAGVTATSIVGYVQEKTAGIATEGAMTELGNRVTVVEGDVATIKGDHLKAADKAELEGKITDEANRATGIEAGLESRLAAVEGDYLKNADKAALEGSIAEVAGDVADIAADYLVEADKTELQGKIDLKADASALAQEVTDRTNAVAGLQTQINTIMNNPDTDKVIDSITEFTAWIDEHGDIAEGMRTDIDKNKDDIAAEVDRAGKAEAALAARLDELEDIDHEAYVAADTALKNELNGEIAKKADTTALTSAVETLSGVDAGFETRIASLEGKFGTGDGTVDAKIEVAKQAAIDSAVGTAAADATSKANAAEAAAKSYADGLDSAMNTRVLVVEGKAHEHANKELLDTYTQTEANLADAVAKKHAHGNMEVLEGITATKVTAWDNAEGNAKTFAQGLNDTMSGRVTALEAWHENFVECSQEDIQDLFK